MSPLSDLLIMPYTAVPQSGELALARPVWWLSPHLVISDQYMPINIRGGLRRRVISTLHETIGIQADFMEVRKELRFGESDISGLQWWVTWDVGCVATWWLRDGGYYWRWEDALG